MRRGRREEEGVGEGGEQAAGWLASDGRCWLLEWQQPNGRSSSGRVQRGGCSWAEDGLKMVVDR